MPIAPIVIALFKRKNAVHEALVKPETRSPKPIALTVRGELFALLMAPLAALSANSAETSCLPIIKLSFECDF